MHRAAEVLGPGRLRCSQQVGNQLRHRVRRAAELHRGVAIRVGEHRIGKSRRPCPELRRCGASTQQPLRRDHRSRWIHQQLRLCLLAHRHPIAIGQRDDRGQRQRPVRAEREQPRHAVDHRGAPHRRGSEIDSQHEIIACWLGSARMLGKGDRPRGPALGLVGYGGKRLRER
jgi:hypothetical protein